VRICVLTTAGHGLGGMQRHTHDLVRGLVAVGHDVDVICPAGDTPRDAYGGSWRYVDAYGSYTDRFWLRESADEFERAHRERRYDVVHGEGSSGLGFVLRGLHREVPLVEMFHSVFSGLARASLRRALIRRSPLGVAREGRYLLGLSSRHFRRGNWYRFRPCEIIVPSYQQVRDTVVSHLVRRARVHVVLNGVDADRWSPIERGRRSRPLVVAGGRFDRNKALDVAIRAMRQVDAELVLTGDGKERTPLQELARRVGVADRVTFVGKLPLDELVQVVASADAYLFPTLEYEASGLALLEAMSAGVPVIAAEQGATSEAIDRPGENGLLVRPASPEAVASALNHLLADDALRARMSVAARERILSAYTLEHMIVGTVAVYERAARADVSASPRTRRGSGE
jgi:glycosyltransferase involved in cell wall biosynthesis